MKTGNSFRSADNSCCCDLGHIAHPAMPTLTPASASTNPYQMTADYSEIKLHEDEGPPPAANRQRGIILAVLMLIATLWPSAMPAQDVEYNAPIDLGTLGGDYSSALAVDSNGAVVGWSSLADNVTEHAFLWTKESGMKDLGTLGGKYSVANGIDNLLESDGAGIVVGESLTKDGVWHAFSYSRKTEKMSDLGTLGGRHSFAFAITDQLKFGENKTYKVVPLVVGRSQINGGETHAFLYTTDNGMKDLGTLGWYSAAKAISPSGRYIVGSARFGGALAAHAFFYTDGQMQDLGTLGGDSSEARAVSPLGDVVGDSRTDDNKAWHAFLWSRFGGGGMKDLGTVGKDDRSFAHGVAWVVDPTFRKPSKLVVVGESDSPLGLRSAFVYKDGKMTDLNQLVPFSTLRTLTSARAINYKGWIVGDGQVINNEGLIVQPHAFLLTPVKDGP